MTKWILFVILLVLNLYSVRTLEEPQNFKNLKIKYTEFLKVLPDKYTHLRKKSILTGTNTKGDLGYNINKGSEIAICVDGDVNSMFHVLLHEMAHSTVEEYKHSENFWDNFKELRDIAVEHDMYTPIVQDKEFCGKKIRD